MDRLQASAASQQRVNANPAAPTGPSNATTSRVELTESQSTMVLTVQIPATLARHFQSMPTSSHPSLQTTTAAGNTVLSYSSYHTTGHKSSGLETTTFLCQVPTSITTDELTVRLWEEWRDMKANSGASHSRLREDSLYIRLAKGELGTDIASLCAEEQNGGESSTQQLALAILESDLTVALVDAKGRVIQPFKRFVRHKNRNNNNASTTNAAAAAAAAAIQESSMAASFLSQSGSFLSSGASMLGGTTGGRSTIRGSSSSAKWMVATQCSANNWVPSQKTIFQLLSTANSLQPPFYIALHVNEHRASQRRVQEHEALLRSRMVEQYERAAQDLWLPTARLMHSDAQLRWDWVQFECHTRQRLLSSMRYERTLIGQQCVIQAEVEGRETVLDEEAQHRWNCLWEEGLRIACLLHEEGRRKAIGQEHNVQLHRLLQQLEDGRSTLTFVEQLGEATAAYESVHRALLDDGWLALLQAFHSAVVSWQLPR